MSYLETACNAARLAGEMILSQVSTGIIAEKKAQILTS